MTVTLTDRGNPAPTVVSYEPRGAARALFKCRDQEVMLDGPAGTGKSLAALYRLHLAALKHPGIKCLIVRKTAVSLTSTTLRSFEEKVAAEALSHKIVKWFGGNMHEPAAYRYSNGSRIVVGGMDKPDKIMSSEYDLAFADEGTELTIEDWEKIGTRLRNGRLPRPEQQIIACNPAHPKHWLNQRANNGKITRLISRHADNPAYVNADGTLTERGTVYLARLDNLTGVRKLRLRDGVWAAADGLIYENWDPAVHVVDRFPIPHDWPRYWGVDFGHTHPFVLQCWAMDPDGRLILYREIFHTKRLVEDHAKQIIRLVTEPVPDLPEGADPGDDDPLTAVDQGRRRWTEPVPVAVICDHDAEGRATLEKHTGLSTTPAHKAVLEGIEAVEVRQRLAGDGRPRIMIMRDSVVERDPELTAAFRPACTEEEIPGYVWAIKPGSGDLKEEPLKEQDDGVDTMRYVVAECDLGVRPGLRFF